MWAKGGMTKWGTEDHRSCPEGQPDLTSQRTVQKSTVNSTKITDEWHQIDPALHSSSSIY